ncbi:MAG TPA: hypothetical protein VMT57_06395 [Candidatus Thermoplasmatota archaeon]|nr:hypothetical protein [Candidatus Thermoplasmatota archaeon]
MMWRTTVRSLWKNDQGVSEEFTSLPTLSVVMMGFSLFLLLLVHTYTAYQERMNYLEEYQIADAIAEKLTNPECCWMENGLVNVPTLNLSMEQIKVIREQYHFSNLSFVIRLRYDEQVYDFPEPLPSLTTNQVAVERQIGVYLNEAQTTEGTFTIIVWRTT